MVRVALAYAGGSREDSLVSRGALEGVLGRYCRGFGARGAFLVRRRVRFVGGDFPSVIFF